MKILHIISTLDPESGGPAECVRTLMTFRSLGYDGEAVTLDDPDAAYLKGLTFPVHALGPVASRFAYSPRLGSWLEANRSRFDGVVVNGLWNYCGVAAWRFIRDRKPYMVFCHGMLDPYFKQANRAKHFKKWLFWLGAQYWVLRGAYRVLFTTSEEAELAKQSFWLQRWRPYVVPYGSSRPPADRERLVEVFHGLLPALRGRRFLLFLGRIHRKKGCDLLMEAFARNSAADADLQLVMAGPDQQGWGAELAASMAQRGHGDRVHWTGMLAGDAKWGAFYACEAFILPSHQENFGIAVAEALACGKAVLLSDKVNIAPQIERDGAGLMEGDDQAGTDALIERWREMGVEERGAMEAQALITFRERYDMERNAETIIRLFQQANG